MQIETISRKPDTLRTIFVTRGALYTELGACGQLQSTCAVLAGFEYRGALELHDSLKVLTKRPETFVPTHIADLIATVLGPDHQNFTFETEGDELVRVGSVWCLRVKLNDGQILRIHGVNSGANLAFVMDQSEEDEGARAVKLFEAIESGLARAQRILIESRNQK